MADRARRRDDRRRVGARRWAAIARRLPRSRLVMRIAIGRPAPHRELDGVRLRRRPRPGDRDGARLLHGPAGDDGARHRRARRAAVDRAEGGHRARRRRRRHPDASRTADRRSPRSIMAVTWSLYGLLKRQVPLPAVEGFAAETFVLVVPARSSSPRSAGRPAASLAAASPATSRWSHSPASPPPCRWSCSRSPRPGAVHDARAAQLSRPDDQLPARLDRLRRGAAEVPGRRVRARVGGAADRHRRRRAELRRPAADRPRPRRISRLASARVRPRPEDESDASPDRRRGRCSLLSCSSPARPTPPTSRRRRRSTSRAGRFSETPGSCAYCEAECEEPASTAEDTLYTCTATAEDGTQWRFTSRSRESRLSSCAGTRVGTGRRVVDAGLGAGDTTGVATTAGPHLRTDHLDAGRRRRTDGCAEATTAG